MQALIQRNRIFLENLFRRGPFERHGFVTLPPQLPIWHLDGGDFTLSDRPVTDWVPGVVENYRRRVEMLEAVRDDAVPMARLGTGTHILAAAFGASVKKYTDSNPAAQPCVANAAAADRIAEPDIWKAPTLYRIFELAEAVERELGKDVPLAWPDAQTGFDTACLIWDKSDLYCAITDTEEREAVRRLAAKCARTLKTFITELRRRFPQMSPLHCPEVWCPPSLGPWVSNDECGAISTANFTEFCLPELEDLARTFGGIGMHCCADAEHQFAAFRRIPNFYGFNRVAAKRGFHTILEQLSGPGSPVHVIAWIAEEDIAGLVRAAPPETRFIFNYFAPGIPEARAWLDRMRNGAFANV